MCVYNYIIGNQQKLECVAKNYPGVWDGLMLNMFLSKLRVMDLGGQIFQRQFPERSTLWLFNIAMENCPFIEGLPIKNDDFPWLC